MSGKKPARGPRGGKPAPKKRAVLRRPPVHELHKPRRGPPKKPVKMSLPMQPTLPVFSPLPVVRFPIRFRQDLTLTSSITFPSTILAQSAIVVIAPYNDYLGAIYTQSNSTGVPDPGTAIVGAGITDPYVTSLLSPVSTLGSTNSPAVRWSKFCVQVIDLDPLSTVQSSMQALCWLQQGVPHIASPTAVNYYSTYTTLAEATTGNGLKTHEISSAKLVGGKCFSTGMMDRSAIELTPVLTGSTAWNALYGNTSGSGAQIGANGYWAPIVLAVTLPPPTTPIGAVAGMGLTNTLRYRLIIEAVIEVAPAPNSFLYRMARSPARTGVGSEVAWFNHQDKLLKQGWVDVRSGGLDRSSKGYLGV